MKHQYLRNSCASCIRNSVKWHTTSEIREAHVDMRYISWKWFLLLP